MSSLTRETHSSSVFQKRVERVSVHDAHCGSRLEVAAASIVVILLRLPLCSQERDREIEWIDGDCNFDHVSLCARGVSERAFRVQRLELVLC